MFSKKNQKLQYDSIWIQSIFELLRIFGIPHYMTTSTQRIIFFYNYKIEISTSAGTVTSEQASQIRLEADNFNKSIRLKCYQQRPGMNNIRYTIYRSTDKSKFWFDWIFQYKSIYRQFYTIWLLMLLYIGLRKIFRQLELNTPLLNHSNLYCIICRFHPIHVAPILT